MIYFMLDDLGCPAGVFAVLFPEIAIQIIHFNLFVSRAGSHAFQRQASFLCLVRTQFLRDHRIDHGKLKGSCCHYNNIFPDSYHICRHSDTMIQIRSQSIQQICHYLFVRLRRILGFLCKKHRVSHNCSNHRPFPSRFLSSSPSIPQGSNQS